MMDFRKYWDKLKPEARVSLADQLGTSVDYLTQLAYGQRIPSLTLAFEIRDATRGRVKMDSWPRKRRELLKAEGAAA